MYWLIGILAIFIIAFIVVKLSIDTKRNPDSKISILDHPSTYNKQPIEMVDKSVSLTEEEHSDNSDIANWEK